MKAYLRKFTRQDGCSAGTVLAVLLLASTSLTAQQAAAPSVSPADSLSAGAATAASALTADQIVTLNPFDVVSERDDGFVAMNAGTATKLGLDMKDMSAPYSVMTGEFIKAMGITSLEEAALWTTNGAPVLDGQGADLFGGSSTATPSSMYFNRGAILNAGQQRNFFLTAGMGDTYNVERIDFGRGPNAVLFNVGANDALGGGISTQGKRARLDRNTDEMSFLVGSWDYYRGTYDLNRKITDRLAVRGNVMLQKRNGWMQQEFEDRRGVTLTGTYRLAPRTELRVEFINDKTERSRVPIPYLDNVSGWNGSTVFDGRIANAMLSANANPGAVYGLTFDGSPQGVFREGGNRLVYDPATNTVMNWIHTGYTRAGDENSRVPIYIDGVAWTRAGNNELLPIGNRGSSGGNRTPGNNSSGGGQAAFYDMIDLPGDRFLVATENSGFAVPNKRFSNMPDVPLFTERTRDANFGFTHQFSDSLFMEVSGAVNKVVQNPVGSHLGLRTLYIDLNRNLPNGQPNPRFLEAFSESDLAMNNREHLNAGIRAYLGYIKNAGKWGHYTFNFSLGHNSREVEYRQTTLSMATAADPREWHAGAQKIRTRYYVGDTERPFFNIAPISFLNVVPVSGGNDGYTTNVVTANPRWVLQNWEDRKERTDSAIFAFAARWFENRLVVSPGVRVDRQYSAMRRRPTSWAFLPDDPNWDGLTLDDRYWRPNAPDDWKTLSYIPRNADGSPRSTVPIPAFGNRPTSGGVNDVNPANPLYDSDRFRGDYNEPAWSKTIVSTNAGLTYHVFDWMALKLNYGDSYKPADVGRMTLAGDDAEPETGVAYEGGLTFSMLGGNLAVTPRYYFNRKENLLGTPPTTGPMNNLVGRRAWDDPSPEGRNPFGFTNVLGGDYFAQKNEGVEIEVAGRITRGLRVMASYGTAQRTDYDRWQTTQAYVRGRQDEMAQALQSAGGMIDTSRKPMNGSRSVNDAPGFAIANPAVTDQMIVNAGNQPSNRTNAVDDYNNMWVQYDNIELLQDTIGLKRMSARIVVDYTIQSGAFKGLRLGLAGSYVDKDVAGYRSGDTLANPAYNPSLPVTATNRPWIDDPDVDVNTPIYVKRPLEFRATIGYSHRLRSRWALLEGKEISYQLNIINLTNIRETYYQDDGVALRPPDGDPSAPNRVAVPSRIASFQRPINFQFTTTIKF